MTRAVHSDESGQTTVLILGVVAVVLMLTAAIISATSVNLAARQLLAEADAAASAAVYAAQTGGTVPRASSAEVLEAAEEHLLRSGAHQRHTELQVSRAWTSDSGQTVHVELTATAELPVLRWVLPAQVEVTADSHARVTVHR
ncbi:hypothetical protein [Nesterenkonia sp.]|uniref:hypothetical protein n=1 Tax=Nesterenkonia sp. TaxID=704201 RepID=UPI00262F3D7E|nr:hypothetical protein [Nesterenkonia sp.]